MALTKYQQWWIRVGGDELNGGGFDSTVTSPGTNYSDQDSSHVTFNGTTITATTSGISTTILITGYTVASGDVGNIVRIASGTNFTAGYYCIVSVNTGAGTWTLDRNCTSGIGAAMVGRMGGANAHPVSYADGGSGLGSPIISSPLIAGNKVNWRGDGSSDPTGTVTWDLSAGYLTFPDGSAVDGQVQFEGYNGRPFVGTGVLLFYSSGYIGVKNLSFKVLSNGFPDYGLIGDSTQDKLEDSYIDGNGQDCIGVISNGMVARCRFISSGTQGGDVSRSAIKPYSYSASIIGNYIKGWRSNGVQFSFSTGGCIAFNIINGCKMSGVQVNSSSDQIGNCLMFNTIYGCENGIRFVDSFALFLTTIINNIISHNTAYGINADFDSAAINDKLVSRKIDYNNYYSNSSGNYRNISAGSNDTTLDPQYANTATGDFTLGNATLKAVVPYPAYPGGLF